MIFLVQLWWVGAEPCISGEAFFNEKFIFSLANSIYISQQSNTDKLWKELELKIGFDECQKLVVNPLEEK